MKRCPPHVFDPASGWCKRCTTRDDMRLLAPGGAIWRPGRTEPEPEPEPARDR